MCGVSPGDMYHERSDSMFMILTADSGDEVPMFRGYTFSIEQAEAFSECYNRHYATCPSEEVKPYPVEI